MRQIIRSHPFAGPFLPHLNRKGRGRAGLKQSK
jgi:hypothetical protein